MTIMAYEDPATHGMVNTLVLYHGYAVAMVPVDDDFWEAVNRAKEQSAAAYGVPPAK
jgi:hypothetical protein